MLGDILVIDQPQTWVTGKVGWDSRSIFNQTRNEMMKHQLAHQEAKKHN